MRKNSIYQFLTARGLLLIILLASVIRMSFFVSLQPWNKEVVDNTIVVADAYGYHELALSLLSEKTFDAFDGLRTPGYPLFVAMIYGISSNSVWFVLLIQILLNIISVWLVYKTASIIFSRKIGLLSAFLVAIDIHQALYAVTMYTDTLFVFLFLASVYYFCRSLKEKNVSSIFISALFLGVATLVRPISMFFPFVAVFFILVLCNLNLRMKLVYSLVFSVIFIATISPWLLHNYSKYGEAKLSSISGSNLLFYNVGYTEVHKSGKSIEEVKKGLTDLAIKQGMDTTDNSSFRNSEIYSSIATQYIKDNFVLYCKVHFMGIVNMYAGIGTQHLASIFHLKSKPLNVAQFGGPGIFARIIDFFRSKTIGEILIAFGVGLYLLVNYLFALYASFLLIRKNERYLFLFILIILYFSALTGVVGLVRYRIPFMPFINILCAVGLFHFYDIIIARFLPLKRYSSHP